MATKPDIDLDPITARLRFEEARLRRRIVWLTLIPVVVAVLLIWITASQVSSARQQLDALQDSLTHVEQRLDSARYELLTRLETLARQRREADSLASLVDTYMTWIERRNSAAAERIQTRAIEQFQATESTPRVYLHILNEEQRKRARAVQSALEAAGLIVPGIEKVARGPSSSELRFFRREDADTARAIQQIVMDSGVRLKLRDLSARYGSVTSIRPGHFEIWFGQDFAP